MSKKQSKMSAFLKSKKAPDERDNSLPRKVIICDYSDSETELEPENDVLEMDTFTQINPRSPAPDSPQSQPIIAAGGEPDLDPSPGPSDPKLKWTEDKIRDFKTWVVINGENAICKCELLQTHNRIPVK